MPPGGVISTVTRRPPATTRGLMLLSDADPLAPSHPEPPSGLPPLHVLLGDASLVDRLAAFVGRAVPAGDVRDVLHQVVREALDAPTPPTDRDEARRWLFGIARHKIADFHRLRRRTFAAVDPEQLASRPAPIEARSLAAPHTGRRHARSPRGADHGLAGPRSGRRAARDARARGGAAPGDGPAARLAHAPVAPQALGRRGAAVRGAIAGGRRDGARVAYPHAGRVHDHVSRSRQ